MSSGIIYVFDLSKKQSFDSIRSWHDGCERNRGNYSQVILVGNKSEKSAERQVSYQEAKLLADELGLNYIEVSALNRHNINNLFDIITRKIRSEGYYSQV